MEDSILGPYRAEISIRKRDSIPMYLVGAFEYFQVGDALIAA